MLRRTLSLFLVCTMAWLPLVSVAGWACGADAVQSDIHAHHAPSEQTPEPSHHVHVCHSVCASCALMSTSVPLLQFVAVHPLSNNVSAKVPSLDIPVQERPPRLI